MPNKNMVSNIGFGIESTHTQGKNNIFSKMKKEEITEITHPEFVLADQEADLLTSKLCFGNKSIFERVKNKMVREKLSKEQFKIYLGLRRIGASKTDAYSWIIKRITKAGNIKRKKRNKY